jgi:diguanylate cyclase (GGDEF)-like protein
MRVAERVRLAIADIRLSVGEDTLSITVSVGACMVEPNTAKNSLILIGDADKALYSSKSNGRNRSTLFTQGLLEKACLKREVLS